MPYFSGSPAADKADSSDGPATDQRGVLRRQDSGGTLGALPDIGAFESFDAQVRGVVFLDLNRDGQQDSNEPGLADQLVYLDLSRDGQYETGEPTATTKVDDLGTPAVVEQGAFEFAGLVPGDYWVTPRPAQGWSSSIADVELVSVANNGAQGDSDSSQGDPPSLSADGRYVAFSSSASNLVSGSSNGGRGTFVYDRQTGTLERVGNASYNYAHPSLSADGRFVAFASYGESAFGDRNSFSQVFVYDRKTGAVTQVSVANDGEQGNSYSYEPSLSADGRFVAFTSWASNLVSDDTNELPDVFVFDLVERTIKRVSVADDGTQGNSSSDSPSLSKDGRFVAFASNASNLVSHDPDWMPDVFVYDRQTRTIKRIGVPDDGTHGDALSFSPSLSANGRLVAFLAKFISGACRVYVYDLESGTTEEVGVPRDGISPENFSGDGLSLSGDGRYVAFSSTASNLVQGDTNRTSDVFIYDRLNRTIERVSVAADGKQGNSHSSLPSLSADGRVVAFVSQASNLVSGDWNGSLDVFVTANRRATGGEARSVDLLAGQILSNVNFGLVPDPGVISGRCFQDVIANGVRDAGEKGQAGWTVYLDANTNGKFDSGEQSEQTDEEGDYTFADLDGEKEYWVGLEVPDGSRLVLPTAQDNGIWNVYLPADGKIADRDFGLRPAQTTGQSEIGAVSGRLFEDRDADGVQDTAELPIAGATVFLDLNDDGVRQFGEPQQLTNQDGQYAFSQLGNHAYTVRVLDVPHYLQTAPIGNRFARQEYSLAMAGTPLGSPQDVVSADFNGDGWLDLALAMFDRNSVALLLNDGHGGFTQPWIEISLAADRPADAPRGFGPVALLAGNFNRDGRMDLAVVNNLSRNVAILLDFNGQRFASEKYVAVGSSPNAITSGDLDQDKDLDLIVTHDLSQGGATKNLWILRNDGQGAFTADGTSPAVGNNPYGAVVGDFNEDGRSDLAVADFGEYPLGKDFGDVRVLLADATGSYQSQLACPVGIGPAALVAADLNGDGHLDLAVANFLSNNVTVCLGAGDGTFRAAMTLAVGPGPMGISATDVDNDRDLDLLVANSTSKKVALLRNRLHEDDEFGFEPAESFGVANFTGAAKVSLATGDLNRDGLVDLALANSGQNSVTVNLNAMVGGSRRLALNGVDSVAGQDFSFRPLNAPPTLDPIHDPLAVNEDAGPLTIALTGITAGSGESQPLRIQASSDNSGLVGDVSVLYNSPDATGSLRLTLAPDQSGRAVITVQVTDGGLDGNLTTAADNGTVSQSFTLTVQPVNDPPSLDLLPVGLYVGSELSTQTVRLTGITAGGGESQPVTLTASTTDSDWIRDLAVVYPGTGTEATLSFTTLARADVFALLTVTVTDAGLDNDLSTAKDNLSVSRAMVVLSRSVPQLTVTVTQASGQHDPTNEVPLKFTVVFSEPVYDFTAEDVTLSGTAPGMLESVVRGSGTTYAVDVRGMTDTGTVRVSLAVGVAHTSVGNPNQASTGTDNQIVYNPWHNAILPADVNADGSVSPLDVLLLINYINLHGNEAKLPSPPGGPYLLLDVNGDQSCMAIDVLLVINAINSRLAARADGEAAAAVLAPSRAQTEPTWAAFDLGWAADGQRSVGPVTVRPQSLKLRYHVFAAFLVGWVSDLTSETSEKDGSGDPSYENAQLQRPQSLAWGQDFVEHVHNGPDANGRSGALRTRKKADDGPMLDAGLDGLLQDLASDLERVWFGPRC